MLPEIPISLCSREKNGTRWPIIRQPIVTKRIISRRITTRMYGFIEKIRPESWPHLNRQLPASIMVGSESPGNRN